MRVLCLYNSTQTYTNTVYEHLNCFAKYSKFTWSYLHWTKLSKLNININSYDIVVLHYSVRLPFNQVDEKTCKILSSSSALKVLFIQDEYDHTNLAKYYIKHIGFDLVFSVVPEKSLDFIYPPRDFPGTRFINNLTGYIPDGFEDSISKDLMPPSKRDIFIGYRGRPLSIRYGQLGIEKVSIGKITKKYCQKLGINYDIEWSEENRIYGPKWYEFLAQCKSMLGSESGSNVFDVNGDLEEKIRLFRRRSLFAKSNDIYEKIIKPLEIDGIMNQISPRIFEMAASRVAMVLFEGEYSGVINRNEHFIELKKDFSNILEVFEKLRDDDYINKMTNKAYEDIILSGKYTYKNFVKFVDEELSKAFLYKGISLQPQSFDEDMNVTTSPVRSKPPPMSGVTISPLVIFGKLIRILWNTLPENIKPILKKYLLRRSP